MSNVIPGPLVTTPTCQNPAISGHMERLFFDGNWLFEKEDINELEVIKIGQDLGISKTKLSATTATFNIPQLEQVDFELYIIIRQYNTWSRLIITEATFEKLFNQLKPFTYFADFLRAFGYREDDDVRIVNGYRWWYSVDSPDDEFAYNIRYFEKHGRDCGSTWSLRHTGVYEKMDMKTLKPTWILIQPSSQISQHLEEHFRLPARKNKELSARSLYVHATILLASSRTWLDYIDYIRSAIDVLRKKAVYSRVGKPANADYSVEFSDCQKIEIFRTNIMRAWEVVGSNIRIVRGCQVRCRRFSSLFNISPDITPLSTLEIHEEELLGYETTLKGILERLEGIARLLGKILEFRHDETMRVQTALLAEIASKQAGTNEQVAQMQLQTVNDSRLLKSLTIMATLYLPASLVLAFFGSNLVQTRETGVSGQEISIVFVQQAWLAVAVPVPLTLATLGLILWMMRRTKNLQGSGAGSVVGVSRSP